MTKEIKHKDRATDLGYIRINNDVIMTIASQAAMEVKGVVKIGCGLGKALYRLLVNKNSPRGVRVQMTEGEVNLTVSIVAEYGVDIPRVADEVQENVKKAVERMTGLVLSEVDVVVESVMVRGK